MIVIAVIGLAISAHAQTYGTISRPDIFGDRQIHYNNGLNGTLSRPDIFGSQTLHYNNGTTIQYGAPDIFGNRQFQVHTMPRSFGGY
jgi:hypothetical protein